MQISSKSDAMCKKLFRGKRLTVTHFSKEPMNRLFFLGESASVECGQEEERSQIKCGFFLVETKTFSA